jgi:hypothetical protein
MQKERRIRVLRRIVVGLAVAALVAPAAQARVDEIGAVSQDENGGFAVIHGDDKAIVQGSGGSAVLIRGDDKVLAPDRGDYGLADYRRALPNDYPNAVLAGDDKVIDPRAGDSTVLTRGDDKVIAPQTGDIAVPAGDPSSPSSFDWSDALVGAGMAFALMLRAGGAVLGTRGRARPAAG